MIRYQFTEAELLADFAADDKKKRRKEPWLEKAKRLTAKLAKSPSAAIASEWSEIKHIYTARQHQKCAYCERLLGPHVVSAVEVDVEHFRPKNAVKPWPTAKLLKDFGLPADLPKSRGGGKGYRALAFHPLNYASTCKTCNSRLKANYFPIAGKHDFDGTDPIALCRAERPYLIYPLGDFDADPKKIDPETIVAFEGIRAVPAKPPVDRDDHDRGRVIIAFFLLNEIRDDLFLLRAKQLDSLFTKLELYEKETRPKSRTSIWQDIELLRSEKNDHAGCVRHLLRRYGHPDAQPGPATRKEALQDLQIARDYARSRLGGCRI